ncbi:orotate phosphoribosyltransferase [Candidatus Woesearchaeota archaeon]|nr:orotate phosphoribosyltransferase [Candidatus Woesearchaeota archaeon]
MNPKETAKILLKIEAVSLRADPPFKWVSGILSPIYTDNRILMSYPRERNMIIDSFLESIKKNDLKPDVIAGIATSGIPWAAWIADKLNLPMVYIRKKQKGHGRENLIEGKLEKGEKVVIIEDLISTGGSSISGVQAVKEAGCLVMANLAIFTYELNKSKENFKRENTDLITLTNFSTLVDVAVEENFLSKDEMQNVLGWSKNPEKWGK